MVDALGNPLAFFLTGGQAHDLQAPVLSAPASPELRESWVGTQSPTLIDGKQLAAGFASSLCGGCQCFSIAVFYCGGAGASGRGRGADDDQQACASFSSRA
jgi:hypothetical protein